MYAAALIIFREVLEAALIISIVLAATKGVASRSLWVGAGVAGGLAGAAIVALFAGVIASAAAGAGQELFNAGVLFTAVAMLGWHNVWMSRHGRALALDMSAVGDAVVAGHRPLYALGLVVGLAVLREGSEVVLFLYGLSAGGEGTSGLLMGGGIGLAAGAVLGVVLYFGLLQIPSRYLFSATSWLILLLAAGLAAQGAGYLTQAGLLPMLGHRIWDSSWLLSEQSVVGQVLHILVGYMARPSGIELVFYGATLAVVGGMMWLFGDSTPPRARPAGRVIS